MRLSLGMMITLHGSLWARCQAFVRAAGCPGLGVGAGADTVGAVQRLRRFLVAVMRAVVIVVSIVVLGFAALMWRINQWPVDLDDLDRLEVGMSKDEVRAIVGRPKYDSGSSWTYEQTLSWPLVYIYFDDDNRFARVRLDY